MREETLKCGHPKSEKNVYVWKDKTFCKRCRALYAKKRYQEMKLMQAKRDIKVEKTEDNQVKRGIKNQPERLQLYLAVLDVLNLTIEGFKDKWDMLSLLNDIGNRLK